MGERMKTPSTLDQRDHAVVEDNCEDLSHPTFEDLPQSCIEEICGFLSPKDIGRFACTCRAYRDAVLSDLVWLAKLPKFYTKVLAEAMEAPPSSSSTKSIYDFLCGHVLLKGGHEAFSLDKATGGVSRSQGARALAVTWGDDLRYWEWLPGEGSSFAEVAYLKAVCWLEVRGQLECTLPVGSYALSWRLCFPKTRQMGRRHPYFRGGLANVYGWTTRPIIFTMDTDDGQHAQCERYLGDTTGCEVDDEPNDSGNDPLHEEWIEFDAGEFIVAADKGSKDRQVKLEYSLLEIRGGNWKSGMLLDGVVIRPSHLKRNTSANVTHA